LEDVIYTLGHSNRTLDELLSIIEKYGINIVVDVRRWPKSRKYPWFSKDVLMNKLREIKVQYLWFGEELGGYRRIGRDVEDNGSGNCFKSGGFRAYAIYITTSRKPVNALNKIIEMANSNTILIFCAEKYPWYCHRKIIADWLMYKQYKVIHIIDINKTINHKLTKCAVIKNNKLYYI